MEDVMLELRNIHKIYITSS